MAVSEHSTGTWEAVAVFDPASAVVVISTPGVYVLEFDTADFVGDETVEVQAFLDRAGVIDQGSLYDNSGSSSLFTMDQANRIYTSRPFVVGDDQTLEVQASQSSGALTVEVPWIANRIA